MLRPISIFDRSGVLELTTVADDEYRELGGSAGMQQLACQTSVSLPVHAQVKRAASPFVECFGCIYAYYCCPSRPRQNSW